MARGLIGGNLRLSFVGAPGVTTAIAYAPAVAAGSGEFLVTWTSNQVGDTKVFGQFVTPSGTQVGTDDFQITGIPGDDTDATTHASGIAWNPNSGEYMVAYCAEIAANGAETWIRRVNATTRAPVGSDVQVSNQGPAANDAYDTGNASIAYSATSDQYLVVWDGDETAVAVSDDEVFMRLVSGTGAAVGSPLQVSSHGPSGDNDYSGRAPDVAWNSATDEFVVVWAGEETANDEEIYLRRVSKAGAFLTSQTLLSTTAYDARIPKILYSASRGEFMLTFYGSNNISQSVAGRDEIWGLRLDDATAKVGGDNFRMAAMGIPGDAAYDAITPDIAPDPEGYLAVWRGNDVHETLAADEFEIWAQRFNFDGTPNGERIRVSFMGPDGDTAYVPSDPAVAYDEASGRHLIVWRSDDDKDFVVDGEFEIYGQLFGPLE